MDNVSLKFISIKLWVLCGVAVWGGGSLLDVLLTYSIQSVAIGSVVSDR